MPRKKLCARKNAQPPLRRSTRRSRLQNLTPSLHPSNSPSSSSSPPGSPIVVPSSSSPSSDNSASSARIPTPPSPPTRNIPPPHPGRHYKTVVNRTPYFGRRDRVTSLPIRYSIPRQPSPPSRAPTTPPPPSFELPNDPSPSDPTSHSHQAFFDASPSFSSHGSHQDPSPDTTSQAEMPPPPDRPSSSFRPRTGAPKTRCRKERDRWDLPPDSDAAPKNLQFSNRKHHSRYVNICFLPVLPSTSIDHPTLCELNLWDQVLAFANNTGWWKFFCPLIVDIVKEFYATFEFFWPRDCTLTTPSVISFRLMNRNHSMSLNDFSLALGFYDGETLSNHAYMDALCDFPTEFNPLAAYRELINDDTARYNSSQSKDQMFSDPALLYIHRFLAFSFSGSCITHMAMNLELLTDTPNIPRVTREMIPLDLLRLEHMHLIRCCENDKFVFDNREQEDQAAAPSSSQPSSSSSRPATMADINRLEHQFHELKQLILGYF